LIDNGRPVPLGPAKQRGMIAALLHRAGEPVRADTLIELLWEPQRNADHRPTLYSLASRLRGALSVVGLEKALVRVPGSYRLDVDPGIVDLHRFRRQLAEARNAAERGRADAVAEILLRALPLWRGEPLAELRSPRAERIRESLNDALLDAHKLLADARLAAGLHHPVLDQLEGLMHVHGLDETLARCWVRALHGAGRHDEAKRFVTAFRRRFRKQMLVEPDLGIEPKPVRSPSWPVVERVPRHLPPDITDFTGRDALLAELDELKDNNVVVITGMPGVGKTTLATHWAHRLRHLFPDGQLYLDAGAYGSAAPIDPQYAIDQFLRVLGLPPDQLPVTVEQGRDRFEDLIGDRRILILIDNVLDSTQVRPLIPRSMNCLTIITSRTRLSWLTIRNGVRTVTVPPVSEAESTALLTHIVGARGTAEIDGLRALAQLSGGLPLAVRIIGEHVAERPRASISELAGELRHRILDAAGTAGLAAVFDWSHQALRSDAAHLFRRISLHPGTSISPEAAAAIVGAAVPGVEGLLDLLAKAHMVNHDTARRYRFHDLLRRYATERAATDDDPAMIGAERRRLLDWYLLSAANAVAIIAPEWPPMPDLPDAHDIQPMTFGTDSEAMKWCDAERDNLVAVSRWADRHGCHRHGWQIPGVIHEILERYGGQPDILSLNQQAMVAACKDGHEVGRIGTLINLGTTYFALHDFDQAAATFVAARQLADATGHFEEAIICSHNLASTYLSSGDVRQAVEIYQEALRACRRTGNEPGEAAVLHWLGEACLQLGHQQQAAENYLEALAIRERIGAQRGTGQSHSGLGSLYLATGRLRLALRHCETALTIHTHAHDQKAECDTLITLADIQCGLERHPEAIRSARRATSIGEQMSDSFRQVKALASLSDALLAAGDLTSADHHVRAARRILAVLSGVRVRPLDERVRAVERAIHLAAPEFRAG
jgi:DNA-binding SARP family transcriptional activator/tetratricopeptide (TPR) repeat protein